MGSIVSYFLVELDTVVGKMAGRMSGSGMVTVIDCMVMRIRFCQDQIKGECIIGIPENAFKELSVRPQDKPGVHKAA